MTPARILLEHPIESLALLGLVITCLWRAL